VFFNLRANPRCVRLLDIVKYLSVPNGPFESLCLLDISALTRTRAAVRVRTGLPFSEFLCRALPVQGCALRESGAQ
jgi:hypothetical protein